jgi:hypothetical protein
VRGSQVGEICRVVIRSQVSGAPLLARRIPVAGVVNATMTKSPRSPSGCRAPELVIAAVFAFPRHPFQATVNQLPQNLARLLNIAPQ